MVKSGPRLALVLTFYKCIITMYFPFLDSDNSSGENYDQLSTTCQIIVRCFHLIVIQCILCRSALVCLFLLNKLIVVYNYAYTYWVSVPNFLEVVMFLDMH